jgi:uncharacterized RDD family membrane protein YckC
MWNDKRPIPHLTQQKPSDEGLLKDRSYAFITDLFLIGIINRAIMFTYGNFVRTFFYQMPYSVQKSFNEQMVQATSLSFIVVFWGYFLLSYYLSEGRTPGKIIFHLKVQSPHTHEGHLSLKSCVLRTLGYFVALPSFFALLAIPFFRKDKKGIPDMLSNTFIMSIKEERYIDSLQDETGVAAVTPLFPEDPVSKDISDDKKSKKLAS